MHITARLIEGIPRAGYALGRSLLASLPAVDCISNCCSSLGVFCWALPRPTCTKLFVVPPRVKEVAASSMEWGDAPPILPQSKSCLLCGLGAAIVPRLFLLYG